MPGPEYYRPLAVPDAVRPDAAQPLAGGASWFSHAQVLRRDGAARIIPADNIPPDILQNLTGRRAPVLGLTLERPRLMGVVNATPDSFSDGGQFADAGAAIDHARALLEQGADILDIGGESTRPGSKAVDPDTESDRVIPVIRALFKEYPANISVDTRKAGVAARAITHGARMINDVSALEYDADMAKVAATSPAAVCLMHAQGDPRTMQIDPVYDDVLLDVYDYLKARIAFCEGLGIARDRIVIDPGIGFGKTLAHNLALIRGLSLFHGLGCAVLLGASRKRFVGTISGENVAARRAPGSIAVALEGLRQGVQMLRVHDISETAQAVALWRAMHHGFENER